MLHEGCQNGSHDIVQRRANRYEFRYRLPDDLAGKAVPPLLPSSFDSIVNASAGRFKREIIKSLGTNDLATANRKVLSHIAEAQGLIDQVRRFIQVGPERSITSEQIDALVTARERTALVEDEERRRLGMGFRRATVSRSQTGTACPKRTWTSTGSSSTSRTENDARLSQGCSRTG